MIRWALQQRGMVVMAVAHWGVLVGGWLWASRYLTDRFPWRPVLPYWQEVSNILAVNIGALFVLVVVNLMTAGVGGLVLLFANGFVLGDMLGTVPRQRSRICCGTRRWSCPHLLLRHALHAAHASLACFGCNVRNCR